MERLLGRNRRGLAPKFADCGVTPQRPDAPYHIKNVGTVSLEAFEQMAAGSPHQEKWSQAVRFLVEGYDRVAAPEIIDEVRFPEEVMEKLQQVGQIVEVRREDARGSVRLFTVYEIAKHRYRIIKHTADINDAYGKDTLLGTTFLCKDDHIQSVHNGEFCITLDFAAWFDQFRLGIDAQRYHTFRCGNRFFQCTRLPMGQRHAVDVAATATDVLLDFSRPGVYADAHVDNVRFLGNDRQAVIDAAATFTARCRQVGAQLNEDTTDIAALVRTDGEYLGLDFDYHNKKVRIAAKPLQKLAALKRVFEYERPTHRHFLAIMGVLFFASPPLRINLAEKYYLLKSYAEISRTLQQQPWLLDAPLALPPSRAVVLAAWVAEVERNTWTAPEPRQITPSWIMVTDASATGWAAVFLDVHTGAVSTKAGKWTGHFKGRRARRSAWAEPQAICNGICAHLEPGTKGDLCILTDAKAAARAYNRKRSMKFPVNRNIGELLRKYPGINYVVMHIPGVINIADAMSRGKEDGPHTADDIIALVGKAEQPMARTEKPRIVVLPRAEPPDGVPGAAGSGVEPPVDN